MVLMFAPNARSARMAAASESGMAVSVIALALRVGEEQRRR